jgi:hypothetical protein
MSVSSAYAGGSPDSTVTAACWWASLCFDLRAVSTVSGVAVAVAISATTNGACVTVGGVAAVIGVMIDASSEESLSAAAAAARNVLRNDDDVLHLRSSSVINVCARSMAKRLFSRPTDSGSDSTACSCIGKRKLSFRGKASRSCGGVDTLHRFEISGGREVARVDGIGTA